MPPACGGHPLRRSLFSFYLLLLGPAGQVQAEKEQVRGKIKQFLGGASPLQTSPAGGAKRPTLCRETTNKWHWGKTSTVLPLDRQIWRSASAGSLTPPQGSISIPDLS